MYKKTVNTTQPAAQATGWAGRCLQKTALASVAALAVWSVSLDVNAMALGALTVRSSLGEPLRAEIEVPQISSEEAASLQAGLGSEQAFRAAGVEYSPALVGARISLQRRANGQAYLRVTGSRPVNEPFVSLVIEASTNTGRVVRDYTMLIDPPNRPAPAQVAVTNAQVAEAAAPAIAPPVPMQATQVMPPTRTASAEPRTSRTSRATRTAAPRAAAGGGEQVSVRRGDTAYGIAMQHAPEGVSLDQMLIAMLRANPHAFIGGNVNHMKAGVVLNMPTADQASATSRRAARRAVVAQTRDFNAYRRGLAQRSGDTRVASSSRSTGGGVQPEVRESRPATPAQDRLTLSRAGASSAAASAETARVAQSRQAQEQAERVAELNRNMSELANLQQGQAAPAPASAALPGVAIPVASAPVVPAAPAPAESSASSAIPSITPEPVPASQAASANEVAVASAQEPAPQPVALVAPPPPAPAPMAPLHTPEPSFMDTVMENPLPWGAGLAVLIGLGGLGLYRLRQRKQGKAAPLDSSFVESRLQPDSFFGVSSGHQHVNTKEGGGSVGASSAMSYSPSQIDAAGDVDPVAEAEVYLAYGREVQAEEILKEALRTQPARPAVHRKLVEIYAKRRDARALEQVAVDAYNLTQGQGNDWIAIAAMGAELDPLNSLYKPGGAPNQADAAPPAPPVFGADTEPQPTHLPEPRQQQSASAPAALPDLDLDFDLGKNSAFKPEAPVVAPAAVAGAAAIAAPAVAAAAAPASDMDMSLDFSPPSQISAPAAQAPAPSFVPADSGMMDFDMDALSADPDSRAPSSELMTAQPEEGDEDPLGTKLSLAQEFHALGDTDGARALVQEVIAESSGTLRARAERFLAELD